MESSKITHQDIQTFADSKVNLHEESAKRYRDQVNNLRLELEDHIFRNPGFSLIKMLLSGSLAKGAALSNLNDIDVAIYMKPEKDIQAESQMLYWLRARLIEAYPKMSQEQFVTQDHSVQISFKGTGLNVDCVPIYAKEDDYDWGYVYSQETGKPQLTNITLQLEFIRKRKQQLPQTYIQTIRLLKWWVRVQKEFDKDFRFKSFMVELICAKLLENGLDFNNFPTALEEFFRHIITDELKTRIAFTDYYESGALPSSHDAPIEIFDPVNPENNVASSYTDFDRQRIIKSSQEAFDAITYARWADTKQVAVQVWQRIFGSSFRG